MISFDQARNQRLFLQSLFDASWGATPPEVPVLDLAEELSLEVGQAIAVAEQLQEKELLELLGAATPQYARVRISPRGTHAVGMRVLRRRAS